MKLFITLLAGLVIPHPVLFAEAPPIRTVTVSEIVASPERFDEQTVRIHAKVINGFEVFAVQDSDKSEGPIMWFAYADAGPSASLSFSGLQPARQHKEVSLTRDAVFQDFQDKLNAPMYPKRRGIGCMSCSRYAVSAWLIGTVQYAGEHGGFGHMNTSKTQFVLERVESIEAKDISSKYDPDDFSVDKVAFPTGYLSGVVVDRNGRPAVGGEIEISDPSNPDRHISESPVTTRKGGAFRAGVPPGRYILSFNTFYPPSPKLPYPPVYFPDSQDAAHAQVFTVQDGQKVGDIRFVLPMKVALRTFSLHVMEEDGTPVKDANVWLSPLGTPYQVVGVSVSHTDEDGRFELQGIVGADYIVRADKYRGLGVVRCSQPLVFRASDPVPARLDLKLTNHTFDQCTNPDFGVRGKK